MLRRVTLYFANCITCFRNKSHYLLLPYCFPGHAANFTPISLWHAAFPTTQSCKSKGRLQSVHPDGDSRRRPNVTCLLVGPPVRRLSVSLLTCLFACLSLPTCQSTFLPVCLPEFLYLPACLLACLTVPACLFTRQSKCLPVCLPVYLPICLPEADPVMLPPPPNGHAILSVSSH